MNSLVNDAVHFDDLIFEKDVHEVDHIVRGPGRRIGQIIYI